MIENELAAINSVSAQYDRALRVGAVDDVAAEVSNVLNALQGAGLQSIIDEYQSQVDAFLASK